MGLQQFENTARKRQKNGTTTQAIRNDQANYDTSSRYSVGAQSSLDVAHTWQASQVHDDATSQYMQSEWPTFEDIGLNDRTHSLDTMPNSLFQRSVWPDDTNHTYTFTGPYANSGADGAHLDNNTTSNCFTPHIALNDNSTTDVALRELVGSPVGQADIEPIQSAIQTTFVSDFYSTHIPEQNSLKSCQTDLSIIESVDQSTSTNWINFNAASNNLVPDDGLSSCPGHKLATPVLNPDGYEQYRDNLLYASFQYDVEPTQLMFDQPYLPSSLNDANTHIMAPPPALLMSQGNQHSHQLELDMNPYTTSSGPIRGLWPFFDPNHASASFPPVSSQLRNLSTEADFKRASLSKDSPDLLRGTVVNKVNLDDINQYKDPATEREQERERYRIRKRTRRVGEKARASCWLCQHYKRKCARDNSNKACSTCQIFTRKYLQGFSLQKFTCTVETKFAEFNLFTTRNGTIEPSKVAESDLATEHILTAYTHKPMDQILVAIGHFQHALELTSPLMELLDFLEPNHLRRYSRFAGNGQLLADIRVRSYSQNILRWKPALLLVQPQLRRTLGVIEEDYRASTQALLALFANRILYRRTDTALLYLGSIYADVCSMKFFSTEMIDKPAVQHFQCAIEHRLTFLYATLLKQEPTQNLPRQREEGSLADFLGPVFKILRLLPPHYSEPRESIDLQLLAVLKSKAIQSDAVPNPTYDYAREGHDTGDEPQCFCWWALSCIPRVCLDPFGFDSNYFRQLAHRAIVQFDETRFLEEIYYILARESKRSLLELGIIYGGVISALLRIYFDCLTIEWPNDKSMSSFSCLEGRASVVHKEFVNVIPLYAMKWCVMYFDRYLERSSSFNRAVEELEDWIYADNWVKTTFTDEIREICREVFENLENDGLASQQMKDRHQEDTASA